MRVLKACQKLSCQEPSADVTQVNRHQFSGPDILGQRMKRDGKGGFHFEPGMTNKFESVKRWQDMQGFINLVHTTNPLDPENTALTNVPQVTTTSLTPIGCSTHGDWGHLPVDICDVDDTETEELWTSTWTDIKENVNELPWTFALYIYVMAEDSGSRDVRVFVSRCPLQVQDNYVDTINNYLALLTSSDDTIS